ncbi:hypothetical protein FRB94_003329, partial [Tulasnella sp. JGI-2019a]
MFRESSLSGSGNSLLKPPRCLHHKTKRVFQLDPFCKTPEPPARATTAITLQSSTDMSQPLNPCSSVPVASAKVTEEILPSTPSFDLNQETLSIKHSPTLLDLNATERADATSSRPLALMMARNIHDLDKIVYPKGIKIPDVELNKGAMQGGKFKYAPFLIFHFELRLIPMAAT